MAFKGYKEEITGADVKKELSRVARDLVAAIERGDDLFEQWEAVKAGKTDAEVEAALGVTPTVRADIQQSFVALRDVFKAAGGDDTVTIPTANTWLRRLREFS